MIDHDVEIGTEVKCDNCDVGVLGVVAGYKGKCKCDACRITLDVHGDLIEAECDGKLVDSSHGPYSFIIECLGCSCVSQVAVSEWDDNTARVLNEAHPGYSYDQESQEFVSLVP